MDFIPNNTIEMGMMKIRIEAVGGDLDRIACRYPVSFMNEMARQLTSAIESACSVEGIADSSVELVMMFASSTYMEHISGNVTYRRLMLIDAVSAPRDFWVKWTKLAPTEGEYTEENILFELGEDVDQKIRQTEYKYLLNSGKEKYHNSMSRKKVTEWREVIKRAARRGEIKKVESDFELTPETLELEERIADLLGKRIGQQTEPKKEEVPYITPEDDDFARAMAKARMVVESAEEDEPVETVNESSETEEPVEMINESSEIKEAEDAPAEPEFDIFADDESDGEEEIDIFADVEDEESAGAINESTENYEELVIESEDEFVIEDDEPSHPTESGALPESEPIVEEPEEELVIADGDEEAPAPEEILEEDEPEIEIEIIEEPIEASIACPEIDEESAEASVARPEIDEEAPAKEEIPVMAAAPVSAPEVESVVEEAIAPVREQVETIADRIADIRAELEIKIRLEYESRARIKAEEELIKLRHELQRVKSESESVITDLVKENEKLRMEYEHLLEQTERETIAREAELARRRAEEEQLRAQIEMQLREEATERERLAEAARLAIEEQRRLEAENARIARQREEEERLEAERIRREEEEKAIEAVRQAELERIRKEEAAKKAKAKSAMPTAGDGRYSYTSKTVKFLFRRSVDPNITARIQEIIKATVDYYGKDNVYLKIKAIVPDSQTVVLEFVNIPIEEMELLGNIIKILGNSGLGIAKAIIE